MAHHHYFDHQDLSGRSRTAHCREYCLWHVVHGGRHRRLARKPRAL
jgi:hypothetical protein